MPQRVSKSGSELFIVDNSDADWKAARYLRDWCQLSKRLDIATGFFEIGSLLALDGEWQKVDEIRILMGGDVSLRTKAMFVEAVEQVRGRLDDSLEVEKQRNDFLTGVPTVPEFPGHRPLAHLPNQHRLAYLLVARHLRHLPVPPPSGPILAPSLRRTSPLRWPCLTRPSSSPSGPVFHARRQCACVIIDCSSGTVSDFRPEASAERLAPCSTFKIWNALIGLESGVRASADESLYRWDGQNRTVPDWNRDLTFREAFQASCVPAFQNLAREVGPQRMQTWIDRIGYGDRDTSAGIDVFWLPAKGRKTILISPKEQAQLMCKLVSGQLPFPARPGPSSRT